MENINNTQQQQQQQVGQQYFVIPPPYFIVPVQQVPTMFITPQPMGPMFFQPPLMAQPLPPMFLPPVTLVPDSLSPYADAEPVQHSQRSVSQLSSCSTSSIHEWHILSHFKGVILCL